MDKEYIDVTCTGRTKDVYVFTGGPTDGSESEGYWYTISIKDAAIEEIVDQPFY